MINVSNDSSLEQYSTDNTLHLLMKISFPYIFIVSIIGICGNVLTILMLSKRSLSKNFNNCTLIALALTDLLFNFTLISRCINDIAQVNNEQLCRLLSFLSHLAELLSACFTAHFTAQRFIAVRFPLSVLIEKRVHLLHYLIVSLFIIFGIIYCLSLVEYNAYEYCHEELELKWFISDGLLSFVIPFTLITILNILIIFNLKKSFHNNQQFRFTNRHQYQLEVLPINYLRKKKFSSGELRINTNFQPKTYENVPQSHSRNSFSINHTNGDSLLINGRARSMDLLPRPLVVRSKSQSYRVTRMLIIVSTCFLLLNAPAHICTVGLKIYTIKKSVTMDSYTEIPLQLYENFKQHYVNSSTLINDGESLYITRNPSNQSDSLDNHNNHLKWMEFFYIIVIVTQHIAYASYSINFFLYSFCGMKFRHELLRCLSQKRRSVTISRSTTCVQNAV